MSHTDPEAQGFPFRRKFETCQLPGASFQNGRSSIHSTPAVQELLEKHPRVHFHFTPTGASWINLVEAWFSILKRKSIRRGSFDTIRQLIRHIENYLAHWNDDPTPFVWLQRS